MSDSDSSSQQQQQQQQSNGASTSSADDALISLPTAMKAADAIRKTLRERNDEVEASNKTPPGSLPGFVAFLGTGLLLSPLRSAILRRAAAAAASTSRAASKPTVPPPLEAVEAASNGSPNPPPPPPTQQSISSFANLVDLMVTPILAVISAQVGLVVGTLYGSSYYLERVVESDGISSNSSDAVCQSLLSACGSAAWNESAAGNAMDSSITTTSPEIDGILQISSSPSPPTPTIYPSWDPRQQTLERLHHAIQHCQDMEKRRNSAKSFE